MDMERFKRSGDTLEALEVVLWYTEAVAATNKKGACDVKQRILIIEDEMPIADILKFTLSKEGYDVNLAYDGEEALEIARKIQPDLILLDLMLPKKDGFQVCREIRTFSDKPIIILTARDTEVDKVLGLELGADDYVTKPFSSRELLARIKANLRRTQGDSLTEKRPRLVIDDLEIDSETYEVQRNGRVIDLTHREFQLLEYLARNRGVVLSREHLLQEVWGFDYLGDVRTVDVTIRRLREKIEDDSSNPVYILTRRGVGYSLKR